MSEEGSDQMEFEALKKVAAAVLGMDPDEIEMDMTFLTDLGADSLDLYQILRGVEEETGLLIPTEGLEKITTVREAVEWIKKTRSPL
jgi:acyl carrier protein